MTRRVLLRGSAGAGLAGLLGCTGAPSSDSSKTRSTAHATEEAAIFDLSFRTVDRFRPVHLLAPGFEVDLSEAAQVADGSLRRATQGLRAPFAAVEVQASTGSATSTRADATVAAGVATRDGDHVVVRWSGASRRISLEVRRQGRSRVLRRKRVDLTGSFGLAFALCENQVTALVDTGTGWRPVLTERTKVAAAVDLRREDTLRGYSYAWEATGVDDATARAGVFGMTGLRDPHLVQHADGTPFERDGRVYLTWTCAGLGFFQQAHWTVWSLDPAAPREMRLESQVFTRRDGLVLGDHAGQIVRDGDRWLVATSSWGDFFPGSIHVRHCETREDLLSGVHVVATDPSPLPTDHGSWDPAMTRVDGRWTVGFVESPSQDPFDFHPALASTDAPLWVDELSPVAAATDLHQCEGPILTTVKGTTYLVASDGDDRSYPVFDLDGRRIGELDAPYPTNIPHPNLIRDPDGGWLLVTFDGRQYHPKVMGYGGHGDVVVMRST